MDKNNLLKKIKKGLIVSCQALDNEPLHGSNIMAKMALAAKEGGACGIRANSVSDIDEIKKTIDLPIVGLIKKDYLDSDIYITPTINEVKELVKANCEMIALDATDRKRPNNENIKDLVDFIHQNNKLAVADISTYEEGIMAELLGFDIISTTMSGYTPYSPQQEEPDYKLVKKLVKKVKIPVIAEGRISNSKQLKKMIKQNPFCVIIGGAITRPQIITQKFKKVLDEGYKNEK